MYRNTVALVLLALVCIAGCGKSGDSKPVSAESSGNAQATNAAASGAETPEGAVTVFLSAVCAGDDQRVAGMLTDLARQKTAEMDLEVAPPGSDSAQFVVGKVEYVDDSTARVACTWSDLNEDGDRTEESILWALRHSEAGWRIAGMAPTIFPGEPPLLLNFEKPDEMLEKLEWVKEEALRRAQAEMAASEEAVSREAQQPSAPVDGRLR